MKHLTLICSLILLISCSSNEPSNDSTSEVEDTTSTDTTTLVEELVQEPSLNPENLIEFAVSNQEGSQIKVLNSSFQSELAEEYTRAIGINNDMIGIHYLKLTEATEDDNHRQTPYNFDNLLGWLYDVNGKVEPWEPVVLFTLEFLSTREYISPTTLSTVLTQQEATQIETDKNRKIIRSEEVATYPNGMSTHFIEFEELDSALLVCFVMKEEDGKLTYYDFPATKGEYSCWRVDDGCEFDFEYFPILGAFKGPEGYELFASWIGAEGSNSYYLVQEGNAFIKKKAAYYYQAPL